MICQKQYKPVELLGAYKSGNFLKLKEVIESYDFESGEANGTIRKRIKQDIEGFINKGLVSKVFGNSESDHNAIFEILTKFAKNDSDKGLIKISDISHKLKTRYKDIGEMYLSHSDKLSETISNFNSEIIRIGLFNNDPNDKVIFDSSYNNNLNKKIFEYKKNLLKNILLGVSPRSELLDQIDGIKFNVNVPAFNQLVQDVLKTYISFLNTKNSISFYEATDNRAYNSFVTFYYFDNLLLDLKFIDINKKYTNSPEEFFADKYSLTMDTTSHYTGFSNDEDAGIIENSSMISKLFLSSIPEVNSDGSDKNNTNVGVVGYIEIMNHLKELIISEKLYDFEFGEKISLRDEFYSKGINFDYPKAIKLYESKTWVGKSNVSSISKLRGISKYVFNENLDPFLRSIVLNSFLKSAITPKISYAESYSNNTFEAIESSSYLSTPQKQFVRSRFLSAIEGFKSGILTSDFTNDGYSIMYNNDKIFEISNTSTDRKSKVEILVKFENIDLAKKFISDILQIDNLDLYSIEELNSFATLATLALQASTVSEENRWSKSISRKLINDLADLMTNAQGDIYEAVIKDPEGNGSPVQQLTSLAYKVDELKWKQSKNSDKNGIIHKNIFSKYPSVMSNTPFTRWFIEVGDKVKQSKDLSSEEVSRVAFMDDFYNRIMDGKSILMQPATFSDKRTHFLIEYNLNSVILENRTTLDGLIKSVINGERKDQALEFLRNHRLGYYSQLVSNSINDLKLVFTDIVFTGNLSNDIILINNFLKGKSKEEIENLFNDKLDYKPNHYFSSYNNEFRFNKTIDFEFTSSLHKDIFNNRINLAYEMAKEKLGFLQTYEEVSNFDNAVFAYVIADNLFSHDYNNLIFGGLWNYPNSINVDIDYIDSSMFDYLSTKDIFNPDVIWNNESKLKNYPILENASKLTLQTKRTVTAGATIHPFEQNLKNGVASTMNVAVMSDIQGYVYNLLGKNESLDAHDGSTFVSPFQSILENNSLLGSKVGVDKKTIISDVDGQNGWATLIKHAAFAVSNDRRRMGYYSKNSFEKMFEKMHNFELKKDVRNDVVKLFNAFTFKDAKISGEFVKRISIVPTDNLNEFEVIDVINGLEVKKIIQINSLYDLDQLFGGAWVVKEQDFNDGVLTRTEYSDYNINSVFDIIIEHDLKTEFIAYVTNKSAMKTGSYNINKYDDSNWNHIPISTRFAGVQMNADHSLLDSEVSEVTQMIQALEQNGYTHDLVKEIYEEMASVMKTSFEELNIAISDDDNKGIYMAFAKSLIQSIKTNDSSIGLAKSFIELARKSLKEANIEYKIPFSDININSKFTSTVSSNIIKSGIKRKYSGASSYLVPSYGMVQLFQIDGVSYGAEEVIDLIVEKGIRKDIHNEFTIEDIFSGRYIDVIANEQKSLDDIDFVKNVKISDIQIGDEVIYYNEGNIIRNKINTISEYYEFKSNKNPLDNVYIFELSPKNLQGSKTLINIDILDKNDNETTLTFDVIDTSIVKANVLGGKNLIDSLNVAKHYFPKNSDVIDIFINKIKSEISFTDEELKVVSDLSKILTQKLMDDLENEKIPYIIKQQLLGLEVSENDFEGKIYANYTYIPNQVVTGMFNFDKFGLKFGDKISSILKQGSSFFEKRLLDKFSDYLDVSENPTHDYDRVLFTDDNNVIYVKNFKSDEEMIEFLNNSEYTDSDTNFETINGITYFNDEQINISKNAKFFKHKDIHLIATTNFKDLESISKMDFVENYLDNYNVSNLKIMAYLNNIKSIRNLSIDEIVKNNLTGYINELNLEMINKLKRNLKYRSFNMFDSFKLQLESMDARVPAQSQQSMMMMKTSLFANSLNNEVYVPIEQTWLQGSDYDIDKLFMMMYSITDNGEMFTKSKLRGYSIKEIQELPYPNKLKYYSNRQGENIITEQDLDDFEEGRLYSVIKALKHYSQHVKFEINETYEEINGVWKPSERTKKYIELSKKFLKTLNDHSFGRFSPKYRAEAEKNMVLKNMIKVASSPLNQINLTNPMESNEVKKEANKYIQLKDSYNSSDNPVTKYINQENNMIGSRSIGNYAIGMKAFFTLSYYYNEQIEEMIRLISYGDFHVQSIIDKLNEMYSGDRSHPFLANISLNKLYDYIENLSWENNENDDYVEILEHIGYLKNINIPTILQNTESPENLIYMPDGSLLMSAFITEATDNAKNLNLYKLNAGDDFANLYGYMISFGYSIQEMAKIMTDKSVDIIKIFNKKNIFDPLSDKRNIRNTIEFLLGKNPLNYTTFFKIENVSGLISRVSGNFKTPENYEEFITNIENLPSNWESIIDNKINNFYKKRNFEDFEYELIPELDGQISTNTLEINDYVAFKRIVHDIKLAKSLLNGLNDNNIKNLESLLNITQASEEYYTYANALGINQGFKTDQFDKLKYAERIQNSVNFASKNYRKNKEKSLEEAMKIANLNGDSNLSLAIKSELDLFKDSDPGSFETIEFIRNPEYGEFWENYYEEIKKSVNILKALNVPHIKGMLDLYSTDNYVINTLSFKNYAIEKLMKDEDISPLIKKKSDFRKLSSSITEFINYQWLEKNEIMYENSNDKSEGIPISSRLTRDTVNHFINLFNSKIIPELKKKYHDNDFIQSLIFEARVLPNNKKVAYWRPSINMAKINDHRLNLFNFNRQSKGFDILHDKSDFGMNLHSMFFLYNLIINNGAGGQSSFTKFFEKSIWESLDNNDSTNLLISSYFNYINDVDTHSKENIELSPDIIKRIIVGDYINAGEYYSKLGRTNSELLEFKKIDYTISPKSALEKAIRNLSNGESYVSIKLLSNDEIKSATNSGKYNVKAFIENSTIYINKDKASITDLLHEYAHLYFAVIKMKNPEVYYKLMQNVTENDVKGIKEINIYNDKHGSDLHEEIVVTMISEFLNGKKLNEEIYGNALVDSFNTLFEISENDKVETYEELMEKVNNLNMVELLSILNNNLVSKENYLPDEKYTDLIIKSSKISTLKDILIKRQELEINCN